MSVKIYTGRHSDGAKSLSENTGFKRLKLSDSKWKPKAGDVVINWGNSSVPGFNPATVVNKPQSVGTCTNKLKFFQTTQAKTPDWTTEKAVATGWLVEGFSVVQRTVLTGHSGHGIIMASPGDVLIDAPLYTKYVKKTAEYRIHVAFGNVVDVQRKIRDPEREPVNWQVRSHENGFIFIRNDVEAPKDVLDQAVQAFNDVGLDFGAVDVIWNKQEQRAYVLEINTAPGLTGQTIGTYSKVLKEKFQ